MRRLARSALAAWLALLPTGCAWTEIRLTPRIAPVVAAAFPAGQIKDVSARVQMGFLEVGVQAAQEEAAYQGNLEIETAIAAQICAALARSDAAFAQEWEYLELTLRIEYGNLLRWQTTWGYLRIDMSRETLRRLGEGNTPASGYPGHWHLGYGFKTRAGKEMLEWPPTSPGPRANVHGQ